MSSSVKGVRRAARLALGPRACRQPSLEGLEFRRLLAQVAGSINQDTLWQASQSPYEVTGDVTVQPGATLEVEPGVIVQFRADTGLTVLGRLLADGTADARIRFQRVPGGGRWDGFTFDATLADSRISYADMSGGAQQGNSISITNSRLTLDHLTSCSR